MSLFGSHSALLLLELRRSHIQHLTERTVIDLIESASARINTATAPILPARGRVKRDKIQQIIMKRSGFERRQESLPVRETGVVTTSEPLRSSEPLLSSTTPALIMPRGVRR
jgi:hypothetical protein